MRSPGTLERPEVSNPPAVPPLPGDAGRGTDASSDTADDGSVFEDVSPVPAKNEPDAGTPASWRGRLLGPDGSVLTDVTANIELHYRYQADVEDGGFALEGVRPGRYHVSVGIFDSEVKRTGLGDRVLLFNHVFAPGEQWSEDIQIPTGLPITGVMQRPDGGPFGSWWVKLSRAGVERERGIEQGSVRVETDDAGRFEFQHVPPGAWTLTYGGPSQHRSVAFTRLPVHPGASEVIFRVIEE